MEAAAGTTEETAAQIDASAASISGSVDAVGASADLTAGEFDLDAQEMAAAAEYAALKTDIAVGDMDASLALLQGDMAATAGEADATGAAVGGLGGLATKGLIALGGAAIIAAGVSVDMASKYQTATTQLAANADITVKSATKIGNAFTNQAFQTIYSAKDTMTAYSGVAGQLGSVEGHALSAKQALEVMRNAQNLAEGSGNDLTSSTQDLATVMQIYGQSAMDSAADSNVLFNAGRLLTGGISTVTGAIQKLKAGMGSAAPTVAQTGGLLLDLADHGETGRKAISGVTSGIATLIKSTLAIPQAQTAAKAAFDQMTPSLQALATQYQNGQISYTTFDAAAQSLGETQYNLAGQFTSSESAIGSATTKLDAMGVAVVNAKGNFVGLPAIISELHDKIQGLNKTQGEAAIANVFGAAAAQKLYGVIAAGSAVYDKNVAAVAKQNSAQKAAEKQANTLGHQLDILKSGLEDTAVKIGTALLPYVKDLVHGLDEMGRWVAAHPKVLHAIFEGIVERIKMVVHSIEGIVGAIEQVVGFFQHLNKNILNAFKDAGKLLYDVGKHIVEGLIHGIEGAVGGVVSAVKHIGSSIIGIAKNIFGIFSPSSVFADMGGSIGDGLIQGLNSKHGEAAAAAASLMGTVAQQGTVGIGLAMHATGAAGTAAAPAAAPASSQVTVQFQPHIEINGDPSASTKSWVEDYMYKLQGEIASTLQQTR
jgi:hypothetical protein